MFHRMLGTWQNMVEVYVTLTQFARQKLIEGGMPADRIVVKPNFVDPDPGLGEGKGGYAIYVGRLSKEKGVQTLLNAWKSLDIPLKVVGDGPWRNSFRRRPRRSLALNGSAGASRLKWRRTLAQPRC